MEVMYLDFLFYLGIYVRNLRRRYGYGYFILGKKSVKFLKMIKFYIEIYVYVG